MLVSRVKKSQDIGRSSQEVEPFDLGGSREGTLYTYISMTHYKSIISIISTCKYVISSHALSSFSIKKYF
jgi:hypothetical protein